MSMFTLATSCLITSNLPWFMDLIFQVLMQYCSLQYRTLLSPPATSTTGYCFCFGSASLFLMELFLHSSPEAYWAPTNLRASSFSVVSFCLVNVKYVSENSFKIFLFFFPWRPTSMWDLSSLTWDQTYNSCGKSRVCYTGPLGKSLKRFFNDGLGQENNLWWKG